MSVPNDDPTMHTPSDGGGFGIVPRFLRERIDQSEIAIYVALSWRIDENGQTYIKQKRLAREAGMSPSSAQRALNSMWEKDLVRWEPHYAPDGKTVLCNIYTLRILKSAPFESVPRPTYPERGNGRRKNRTPESGGHSERMTPLIHSESGGHSVGMTERDPMNETPRNETKTPVSTSSSSSPRYTREPVADDGGPTTTAEPPRPPAPPVGDTATDDEATTTRARAAEIAAAVVAIRPDWQTPGILAQLRQVEHLPDDTVETAFLEAARDDRMHTPWHLAARAEEHAANAVRRQNDAETAQRAAEDWRHQVHEDMVNRAAPETRADYLARMKATLQEVRYESQEADQEAG